MNRPRLRAARLAVFLESAGKAPVVKGSTYREYCRFLEVQYCGLDPEVRRRARVEGRRRIRKEGVASAAIRLIPVPIPPSIAPDLNWKQLRRLGTQYRRRMLRWPPGTQACPQCRMAPNLPKPAYPTRELAEAVRLRQNDPHLHVYPCPAAPNSSRWHLGHRR